MLVVEGKCRRTAYGLMFLSRPEWAGLGCISLAAEGGRTVCGVEVDLAHVFKQLDVLAYAQTDGLVASATGDVHNVHHDVVAVAAVVGCTACVVSDDVIKCRMSNMT